jgi:hypothetical protein
MKTINFIRFLAFPVICIRFWNFVAPLIGAATAKATQQKDTPKRESERPFYKDPGFLSSALSTAGSIYTARQANKTNIALANSAHQREARDLEAAGLNRILGHARGSQGAGGAGTQRNVFDPNTALITAQTRKLNSEAQLNEHKAPLTIAEEYFVTQQAYKSQTERMKLWREAEKLRQEAYRIDQDTQRLKHETNTAKSQSEITAVKAKEAAFYEKVVRKTGIPYRVWKDAVQTAGTLVGGLTMVKTLVRQRNFFKSKVRIGNRRR